MKTLYLPQTLNVSEIIAAGLVLWNEEQLLNVSKVRDDVEPNPDDPSVGLGQHCPRKLQFSASEEQGVLSAVLDYYGKSEIADLCWPWLDCLERKEMQKGEVSLAGYLKCSTKVIAQLRGALDEYTVWKFNADWITGLNNVLGDELRHLGNWANTRLDQAVALDYWIDENKDSHVKEGFKIVKFHTRPKDGCDEDFNAAMHRMAMMDRTVALTVAPTEDGNEWRLYRYKHYENKLDLRKIRTLPQVTHVNSTGYLAVLTDASDSFITQAVKLMKVA